VSPERMIEICCFIVLGFENDFTLCENDFMVYFIGAQSQTKYSNAVKNATIVQEAGNS
jgi:hypothetical protein